MKPFVLIIKKKLSTIIISIIFSYFSFQTQSPDNLLHCPEGKVFKVLSKILKFYFNSLILSNTN
jgi:hypothetical protein